MVGVVTGSSLALRMGQPDGFWSKFWWKSAGLHAAAATELPGMHAGRWHLKSLATADNALSAVSIVRIGVLTSSVDGPATLMSRVRTAGYRELVDQRCGYEQRPLNNGGPGPLKPTEQETFIIALKYWIIGSAGMHSGGKLHRAFGYSDRRDQTI